MVGSARALVRSRDLVAGLGGRTSLLFLLNFIPYRPVLLGGGACCRWGACRFVGCGKNAFLFKGVGLRRVGARGGGGQGAGSARAGEAQAPRRRGSAPPPPRCERTGCRRVPVLLVRPQ